MLRSQSGPGAGLTLSATPSSRSSRIEPHLFRVLLLRRLRLPPPSCLSHLPMWPSNRRGWPPSRSVRQSRSVGEAGLRPRERCCQGVAKGGARVSSHVMVRDLDLRAPDVHDGRRFEVVAEGLPLFGGAQLALDTTLVSALHCDGSARPHAADVDGVALSPRRRRKELTYPELVGPRSMARLVVLAGEVDGGQPRPCHSWACWPKPEHGQKLTSSGVVSSRHGASGGAACWRVRPRVHSQPRCLSSVSIGGDGNAPVSHEITGTPGWGSSAVTCAGCRLC